MGLLDELKKLTKPYDDEDYLEEDMADPVRVGMQEPAQGYAAYAEVPQQQPEQPARRPYVFSAAQKAKAQPQQNPYAQQQAYAQANPYAQQQAYAQANPYAQPQAYAQPQQNPYARQQGYAQQSPYAQSRPQSYAPQGAQPRLLLVKPDRFEQAADIADRIMERSAVVLNLEETERETARRLLDFLSGVTYSLNGNVKKVSGSTYIITPAGMDFMGDAVESMNSRENYF